MIAQTSKKIYKLFMNMKNLVWSCLYLALICTIGIYYHTGASDIKQQQQVAMLYMEIFQVKICNTFHQHTFHCLIQWKLHVLTLFSKGSVHDTGYFEGAFLMQHIQQPLWHMCLT